MNEKNKKVLVLNGSLRTPSSTSVVIDHLYQSFSNEANFTIYTEMATIPPFDDPEVAPEPVTRFRALIQQADGILLCMPEYAFGIPGALKNALDWTVGSGDFYEKKVCIITAATSGEKAHTAILDVLKALSAHVDPRATLLINFIRSRIKDGKIIDTDSIKQLSLAVGIFLTSL